MADNNNAPLVVTPQDRIVDPNRPAGAPNLPQRSAIEIASEAARASIASGGSPVPVEPARDPRNGQFTEPGRLDTARELGTSRQPAAPEPGQAPPAAPAPAPEGQEPPAGTEPAEGQEAEEEVVEETAEEQQAREAQERTVTLLGRNNTEFEFVAPDKETADVLRQLRNQVERVGAIDEARAEIQQRAQEFEALETVLEASPTSFVLDRLQDPEQIDHLVLALASNPEVFARIGTRLQQIAANPQQREIEAIRQENKRLTMEREVATVTEERAAVRQNLEDVRTTVMSLIPATLSEDATSLLFRDCIRDLRDYANRHNLPTLPVRDIPALLATRLTAHGINPVEAAARAADAATRRGATPNRRPAPASPRVPVSAPAKPAVPPPTGKQLVLSAKKKGAAALPPAGAGSPPATTPMTPPLNADGSKMSIEQRIAWHKQQLAGGKRRL